MTKIIYQSMFYSLGVMLMALVFVIQPTDSPEVNKFQKEIKSRFVSAGQELLAGPSVAEPFVLVWSGVASFYDESSTQAIALLQDQALTDLALSFNADYQLHLALAENPLPLRVATEEPLTNIVPEGLVASGFHLVNYPDSTLAYDDTDFILDPEFNENRAYEQYAGSHSEEVALDDVANGLNGGRVAGESTVATEWLAASASSAPVWVTVNDSITNYPYCVGIFNGTVNSYPGTCATESRGKIYEN